MDGWQFEHYVADILRKNGFHDVEVTKGSGDYGVDIVAQKGEVKYAFQCKHYSNQVGIDAVQQVYSGKSFYDCDCAAVITQSGFTTAAAELANKLNVELWDGQKLSQLAEHNKKESFSASFEALLESEEHSDTDSDFDFPVGVNSDEKIVRCNLLDCGNMLVGGADMSPIDDFMHIPILPLLKKNMPDKLKMVAIDTRILEYTQYNGLPHLLIPVATDLKKAYGILSWYEYEITQRYNKLVSQGCRDIRAYNQKSSDGETMPYVLLCISDLGDALEYENTADTLQQILNRGSKVGVVVLGYIRNPIFTAKLKSLLSGFHTRICFKTATSDASKSILGNNDALYLSQNELMYYSGFYADDHRLTSFQYDTNIESRCIEELKQCAYADYDDSAIKKIEQIAFEIEKRNGKDALITDTMDSENFDEDEMFPAAVDVVLETGQASVSMLQRRLKLNYSRAARIVDEMEMRGYVGPFEGSKPRQLLITKEQWQEMRPNTYIKAAHFSTDVFPDSFEGSKPQQLLITKEQRQEMRPNTYAKAALSSTDAFPDNKEKHTKRTRINKHIFVWVGTFLGGILGVDRFMRGQTKLGIIKLLTCGGMLMWAFTDWIVALFKAYVTAYRDKHRITFINGEYSK